MNQKFKKKFLKTCFGQYLRTIQNRNFMAEYQNKKAYGYLINAQRILDIGCGEGVFISLNPKKIVGIDGNRQTVRKCCRKGLNVKYGLAAKIPYPDKSFDGIHCSHMIEHLEPKQVYQFMKEVSRVLKKRGILVIRSPLFWSGFYDNLTHIKPYPPRAITRYLVEDAPDTTYPRIKSRYQKVALHWRYQSILPVIYSLGIHSFKKNGYLLVLKKTS